MSEFIELVKRRSEDIDKCIYYILQEYGEVTIEKIVKEYGKPAELVQNRLDVLETWGVVNTGDEVISRGESFPLLETKKFEINANDLELKARKKLIIKELANLRIASIKKIKNSLCDKGDIITNNLSIYQPVKSLVEHCLVEELTKDNSMHMWEGKKRLFKLKENITVVEDFDSLFEEIRDFRKKRFGSEVTR